ncbi:MAG: acyl dehydratase [Gammaproteobacteria bacterium]
MTKKTVINNYDDFRQLEGQQIIDSDPIEITSEGIQEFCRGTLNDEWIHWDQQRCEESPLGNIIAPGLFLPALFPHMFWKQMEINIPRIIVKGIDGIRVFKPVTVGSQIIGRAIVDKVLDRDKGIEVHYAISFVFADSGETAAVATFINRYWGLNAD